MAGLQACCKLLSAIEGFREAVAKRNGDENAELFTMADEDTIMTHMMDCVALLAAMQQQQRQQDIPVNTADVLASRNRVFVAALSVVGKSSLNCDNKKETNDAVRQLLKAFPVPEHVYPVENGRKGWLPLHWAAALVSSEQYDVTEADVKALYALDPMAIQTTHVNIDGDVYEHTDGGIVAFTPAHLLCMSPATPCSMELVRLISVCSPSTFSSRPAGFSTLHAACCYGTPTVELLQHLLQLDSSQATFTTTFDETTMERRPLGHLCFNLVYKADKPPYADDLVSCLLEVDKSAEAIGDALFGCLDVCYDDMNSHDEAVIGRRNARVYGMVETLLKVNPEAAKYRDSSGYNLLHWACLNYLPSELCINVMKLVLTLHKDAAQEADLNGWLPAYCAAERCDVEVLEFVLNLYPEAAGVVTLDRSSLLHEAVISYSSTALPSVQYLCSRYPAMMQQRDKDGHLPVHKAASSQHGKMLALFEAGGVEQFKMPIAHPADADYGCNGYLPIHLFILLQFGYLEIVAHAAISEAADEFRLLLRLYPEAVNIEGGVGASYKTTPYQLAVVRKLPNYYLRLLLRAAPTLNPPELHRLNYEERRMVMFLAFKATTATLQAPFLLARLRVANKDLVQRVVSFL